MAHGGKRQNSGRKPKSQSEELEHLLNSVWKAKDRKKTLLQLIEDCEHFNPDVRHKSRTLLLNYAYGKPMSRTELTGADGKDLIPSDINLKINKIWGNESE